ncbi:MAG: putative heme transporter [Gaiellaceae bacterium]|nr:putative heme transporter [Gaiellaceae bacterium]
MRENNKVYVGPPMRGGVRTVETRSMWTRRARSGLLVGISAVSLYLLLPSVLAVFASWRSLEHLDWVFAILALASETASFVSLWELDRIALRTGPRFPVAAAQLCGNAVGRILPGGGAVATVFTASMLRDAGIDTGEATAALAATTGLQLATTLALPALALPAIIGGAPISHSLGDAAYLGLGVLVLLLAAGAIAFTTDAPLELAGRGIQWLLNVTVRRHRHVTGLPEELIADRDFIRTTLGEQWQRAVLAAVGNSAFDYLALLCALRAVGTNPNPSLILIAFASAKLLALIPLTPGGVGFVEAGLVGTLTLAGVSGSDAVAATLVYRLVSYWLPLPAGGVAYVLFRRMYGGRGPELRALPNGPPQRAREHAGDGQREQPPGVDIPMLQQRRDAEGDGQSSRGAPVVADDEVPPEPAE